MGRIGRLLVVHTTYCRVWYLQSKYLVSFVHLAFIRKRTCGYIYRGHHSRSQKIQHRKFISTMIWFNINAGPDLCAVKKLPFTLDWEPGPESKRARIPFNINSAGCRFQAPHAHRMSFLSRKRAHNISWRDFLNDGSNSSLCRRSHLRRSSLDLVSQVELHCANLQETDSFPPCIIWIAIV